MHKKLALRQLPLELGPHPNHLLLRGPESCHEHELERDLTWGRTLLSSSPYCPEYPDLQATGVIEPRRPHPSAPQTSVRQERGKLAKTIAKAIGKQSTND